VPARAPSTNSLIDDPQGCTVERARRTTARGRSQLSRRCGSGTRPRPSRISPLGRPPPRARAPTPPHTGTGSRAQACPRAPG